MIYLKEYLQTFSLLQAESKAQLLRKKENCEVAVDLSRQLSRKAHALNEEMIKERNDKLLKFEKKKQIIKRLEYKMKEHEIETNKSINNIW